VADEYHAMLRERVQALQQKTGVLPEKMMEDPSTQIDVQDILDALQIDADCCRTHLCTTVDFRDWY
jgi:DNA-directed RNA polymerase subunit N (RpoN/RPB10)